MPGHIVAHGAAVHEPVVEEQRVTGSERWSDDASGRRHALDERVPDRVRERRAVGARLEQILDAVWDDVETRNARRRRRNPRVQAKR